MTNTPSLEELLEEIDEWTECRPTPKRLVPNEPELRQRYPHGQWAFKDMGDIPHLTHRTIQATLRELTSSDIIHAIYPCSEATQERIFSNLSHKAAEFLREDLAVASPSTNEIQQVQTHFIKVTHEQLQRLESEAWKRWMKELPETPLPEKPDRHLFSLLDETANQSLVNHAPASALQAATFDEKWEIRLAQCFLTLLAQQAQQEGMIREHRSKAGQWNALLQRLDPETPQPDSNHPCPYEPELRLRYPFGHWTFDDLEELTELNIGNLRKVLSLTSPESLLQAIAPCSDAVKEHIFSNCSLRTEKSLREDLAHLVTTPEESATAQEELIDIIKAELNKSEEELWDLWMDSLPADPLPAEADQALILSLDEESTRHWLARVGIMAITQGAIWSKDWHLVAEHKILPLLQDESFEPLLEAIDSGYLQPQFGWQVSLAQCLMTYHANKAKELVI